MKRPLALLLLAAALLAQDPTKAEPEAADVEMPLAGQPVEDRAVVKDRIARFQADVKAAKKDPKARAALLAKLGEWDHPDIYKEAKKYWRDRNGEVAIAAVLACARQETSAPKAGSALWSHANREKREDVRCVAMIAAGHLGYDKPNARKEAQKLFKKDDSQVRKAAARYLGLVKDKSAFRLLAEKLDEPSYNSNDPERPMPESEKRRRWTRWNSNRPWVVWALSELVEGETFETAGEARDWALAEGKEHGIRW
jgi:HEAT repeat protein